MKFAKEARSSGKLSNYYYKVAPEDLGSLVLKARVCYYLGDLSSFEVDDRHADRNTDSIGGYSISYLTYLQMTIVAAQFLHQLA